MRERIESGEVVHVDNECGYCDVTAIAYPEAEEEGVDEDEGMEV